MDKLDSKFELLLSILLAISISEIFKKFSEFSTEYLFQWIILSVIFFALSTILIYYMVTHKSADFFSYILKIIVLYLLVFFPYYLDKLSERVYIRIYLLICSVAFIVWGIYESKKMEKKWYLEPRFLIGLTAGVLIGISFLIEI